MLRRNILPWQYLPTAESHRDSAEFRWGLAESCPGELDFCKSCRSEDLSVKENGNPEITRAVDVVLGTHKLHVFFPDIPTPRSSCFVIVGFCTLTKVATGIRPCSTSHKWLWRFFRNRSLDVWICLCTNTHQTQINIFFYWIKVQWWKIVIAGGKRPGKFCTGRGCINCIWKDLPVL